MSLDVRFDPQAERELLEAADFYDDGRSGLGSEFLDEVDAAIREVIENPESSPAVLGPTRRLVLRRFPYLVSYFATDVEIVVSAIAHQRRRPFYWQDRI